MVAAPSSHHFLLTFADPPVRAGRGNLGDPPSRLRFFPRSAVTRSASSARALSPTAATNLQPPGNPPAPFRRHGLFFGPIVVFHLLLARYKHFATLRTARKSHSARPRRPTEKGGSQHTLRLSVPTSPSIFPPTFVSLLKYAISLPGRMPLNPTSTTYSVSSPSGNGDGPIPICRAKGIWDATDLPSLAILSRIFIPLRQSYSGLVQFSRSSGIFTLFLSSTSPAPDISTSPGRFDTPLAAPPPPGLIFTAPPIFAAVR